MTIPYVDFPHITGATKCELDSDLLQMMEGSVPASSREITASIGTSWNPVLGESYIRKPPATEEKQTTSRAGAVFPERQPGEDEAVGLLKVFMPSQRALWLDGTYAAHCLEGLPYPLNDPIFVGKYVKPIFDDNRRQSGEKGVDAIFGCEKLARSIVGMVASVDKEFAKVQQWYANDDLKGEVPSIEERPAVEKLSQLIANLANVGEVEDATASEDEFGKGKRKVSKDKAKAKPKFLTYDRPSDFTRVRKACAVTRRAYDQVVHRDSKPCSHLRFRKALAEARATRRLEEMALGVVAAPLPQVRRSVVSLPSVQAAMKNEAELVFGADDDTGGDGHTKVLLGW
ncbi:hypothetical protein EDD37DRAFT_613772 [Exophiala viscosa]|uniref:uncharacterized protein n=1 Tax=Exophiala viscosa TaxID=2486360 RepID=UPI00218E19A7|nr:hypothetical protein EDD37DRAFT_613772 [Exophiala viscosa]